MAAKPITAHEYRYKTSSAFVAWIACSLANTRDNGNGTYTIFGIPNVPIEAGNFEVRVKANGDLPASSVLSNNVDFTGDASVGVVEIVIEGLDDEYEVYGKKAGEEAYTLWVDHKKTFEIGEVLDDLEVMSIDGWDITPPSQDVIVEAYTVVTYTATASGGAPVGDLLAGFAFWQASDFPRESTNAYEWPVAGRIIHTNDNGEARLGSAKTFKNGSEIAMRFKGAISGSAHENGIIGARVDEDSNGVEQGLGIASDGTGFHVTTDNDGEPIVSNFSIGDWLKGVFVEGSPNVINWFKSSDGINFTPIDLGPGALKNITVGSFFVIQMYADGVFNRALNGLQYKNFNP